MTTTRDPDDFTGTGELPDALAFVAPSRTQLYLYLEEHGPTTAPEIAENVERSAASIYRSLKDLKGAGLVDSRPSIDFSTKSAQTWEIVDPEQEEEAMLRAD